jgi:hypothetical protein
MMRRADLGGQALGAASAKLAASSAPPPDERALARWLSVAADRLTETARRLLRQATTARQPLGLCDKIRPCRPQIPELIAMPIDPAALFASATGLTLDCAAARYLQRRGVPTETITANSEQLRYLEANIPGRPLGEHALVALIRDATTGDVIAYHCKPMRVVARGTKAGLPAAKIAALLPPDAEDQ